MCKAGNFSQPAQLCPQDLAFAVHRLISKTQRITFNHIINVNCSILSYATFKNKHHVARWITVRYEELIWYTAWGYFLSFAGIERPLTMVTYF